MLSVYASCSESAATLEAESGYSMEEPDVKRFKEYILSGMWSNAQDVLSRLGIVDEDHLWVCMASLTSSTKLNPF